LRSLGNASTVRGAAPGPSITAIEGGFSMSLGAEAEREAASAKKTPLDVSGSVAAVSGRAPKVSSWPARQRKSVLTDPRSTKTTSPDGATAGCSIRACSAAV